MYHTSGKNSQVFLKILNLRISFQTSGHKIIYKEEGEGGAGVKRKTKAFPQDADDLENIFIFFLII